MPQPGRTEPFGAKFIVVENYSRRDVFCFLASFRLLLFFIVNE
jgi:hypothetical protein